MRNSFLAVVLMSSMSCMAPAWATDCEYERPINVSVDAAGAAAVRIAARAGDLRIEGGSGSAVVVTGRACASSASWLQEMDVRTGREGAGIEVVVEIPDHTSWTGNSYATIDLEIHVPAGLALGVEDSSGDAEVRNIASLVMRDSSGDLDVSGVAGEARIEDSSGDLEIADVRGDVDIEDGSGDVLIVGATGDVEIRDNSGDLDLRDIGGTVRVLSDGSGDIVVDGVGGDFTVDSDGSGSIRYDDVSGNVEIPESKRQR